MKNTASPRFDKIVELNYAPLFRLAVRLCNNPVAALVYTQRTFRRACECSRGLPVPRNIRAWLCAILLHQFLEGRSHA